jgi:hypothetical protein
MWLVRVVTVSKKDELLTSFYWIETPLRDEAIAYARAGIHGKLISIRAICSFYLPVQAGTQEAKQSKWSV